MLNLLLLLGLCFLFLLFLILLLYLILAYFRRWFPFPPPTRYPPREFYIQDQVILSGRQGDVEEALRRATRVQLTRLERLDFRDFGTRLESCPGLPNGAGVGQNLVIDLYRIGGFQPDVRRTIDELNRALGDKAGQVISEPNWLAGNPWIPEGSPWIPEGSPWIPEGSNSSKPSQAAKPEFFMSQWAFQNIALANLPRELNGSGVRVGIFDTSPFEGIALNTPTTRDVVLAQTPGQLHLNLLYPSPSANPGPSTRPATDVRNHGYFSSGLIHALAPGSEIHLIRVLENDNRGDLFTLMKAIFNFMKETVNLAVQPAGVVMNLSLGVRVPPDEARFGLPSAVLALQYLMNAARCLGMVVVAAAGNESPNLPLPQPANLPARWPTVIGVAASNIRNQRSCFSNQGVIAAPGGDGREDNAPTMTAGPSDSSRAANDCHPRAGDCQDANCGYGVVGPVLQPATDTSYIFWTGSSFSAPMVTGLAALVLQSGGGNLSPADVQAILNCGATPTGDPYMGAGVINVYRTLTECMRLRKNPDVQQAAGA